MVTFASKDCLAPDIATPELADFTIHGGALRAAERLFPDAPRPWLDLSTGINPIVYPFAEPGRETWMRLPDDVALARLEGVAAVRYGTPAGACVVAAPGTQAVIQRLPDLAVGRDARILGPTYSEFERVFRSRNSRVQIVSTVSALAGADTAILANPNNPDGRITSTEDLLRLARGVGMLIVDEAFADALPPSCSLVPRLPPSRTIVLRSFGKFYGLAGVRLGFAVAAADLAEPLRQMLGPWPVSGPAIAIGLQALADTQWQAATSLRLGEDSERLGCMLRRTGAIPVGTTPLFCSITHPAAPELFTSLARAGILSRPFRRETTWLRFGYPGTEAEWARLDAALSACR